MCPLCGPASHVADRGGDGVDVDRDDGVHGDEGSDSDRAVDLSHCVQLERGHDVHPMGEAGVVALEGECGRAGAVRMACITG